MSPTDQAISAAAIELADAILAEFNNPDSKLKGFGATAIEKLSSYEKIVAKRLKTKASHRA